MKILTYRLILIVFIALTFGFILFNSTRTGEQSAKMSQGVTETIAQIVVPDFDNLKEPTKTQTVNKVHVAVRNLAHALEFAALAFFVVLLLSTFKFNYGRYLMPSVLALFICFTVAVCDEFLQGLISGRASDMADVLMDTLGIIVAILCAMVVDFVAIKFITKNNKKKRGEKDYV